jgi:hypothetical protein
MWEKFEVQPRPLEEGMNWERMWDLQNNFASEDAARFVHSPVGVSLKCRDEIGVQL